MPVIDAHVHLWARDPLFPFAPPAPGATAPDRDATDETLLALMNAEGVQKSVVVQVSHYGWDHRYLLAALARHPDRLIGVARVNPQDPAAPDQLAQLVHEHRIRGLRLNVQPDAAFDWIRGPLMPPLWRRCQELGVVMALQTKTPRLPDLVPLIERFPALTVVVDHMADTPPGDGKAVEALLALARHPKLCMKITHPWWVSKQPYPYADALEMVHRLYDRFGARRLMWGTDWPVVDRFCGYARAVELVRSHLPFIAASDRPFILGGTAATVWKL